MCVAAALGAVLSIAQAAVSFSAAQEDFDNKAAQWRQNATNSLAAGVEDQKKYVLRMSQEQDAFAQKTHQINVEGAEAKANAEVSAASGGVDGLSVDNIISGIDRDVRANQTAARTNYENTAVQLQSELDGTNTQIKNRINSVQVPTAPNPAAFALQGIGGALSAFSKAST